MSDVTQTRTAESVLERLERLAGEATAGPWKVWGDDGYGCPTIKYPDLGAMYAVATVTGWDNRPENAAYIAAADPTTVSALVAVARAAGDLTDGWGRHVGGPAPAYIALRAALARLSGTVE